MKWEIRGEVYDLPFEEKEKLMNWLGSVMKICPHCRKVDCTLDHVDNCDPEIGKKRKYDRRNHYFK